MERHIGETVIEKVGADERDTFVDMIAPDGKTFTVDGSTAIYETLTGKCMSRFADCKYRAVRSERYRTIPARDVADLLGKGAE